MNNKELIGKVDKLIRLYKQGALGGEVMPEDSNPALDKLSEENLLYLTLPMALNYQRNSYKLWEEALATWNDVQTHAVFIPKEVLAMSDEKLKECLTKYKVALQPNKQLKIWRTLCQTIANQFNGSIKHFITGCNFDIGEIKKYITKNKKNFPYLSGAKILNYWLYVLTNYTDFDFKGKQHITIAPDTHVLQASLKLGVINEEELEKNNLREIVSERWGQILKDTKYLPIDLHTPFWLWSRNGFEVEL